MQRNFEKWGPIHILGNMGLIWKIEKVEDQMAKVLKRRVYSVKFWGAILWEKVWIRGENEIWESWGQKQRLFLHSLSFSLILFPRALSLFLPTNFICETLARPRYRQQPSFPHLSHAQTPSLSLSLASLLSLSNSFFLYPRHCMTQSTIWSHNDSDGCTRRLVSFRGRWSRGP